MENHIIIPARFNSSRLPGKLLLEVDGKPLIWHVYQRALESEIESITVATDHIDIFNAVNKFGGNVIMTSDKHVSGTDRLAEVAQKLSLSDKDVVINVQGDEPLIPSDLIKQISTLLNESPSAGIATLCCPISDIYSVMNPNVVKVTIADNGQALYFSRAPIPWNREQFNDLTTASLTVPYYRHIGMYAYKVATLIKVAQLTESPLENCESLEQLRALQAGVEIQVGITQEMPPHGVDTMADYLAVKKIVEGTHGL